MEREVVGERSSWRGKCRAGLEETTRKRVEEDELKCTANAMRSAGGSGSVAATKPFHCDTCLRYFRCPQDIARHRCMTARPRGQVMRPLLKGSQLFIQLSGREVSSKWVAFFQGSRCVCKCVYVCFVCVCVYASVYVCFVYVYVFVCVRWCSQTSSWCPMEAALG